MGPAPGPRPPRWRDVRPLLPTATETAVSPSPTEGPAAWRGDQFGAEDEFIARLSREDVADLIGGLRHFQSTGKALVDSSAQDFPFGAFEDRVDAFRREIAEGRGFVIMRGLPVGTELSEDEAKAIHWALALHLGRPVPQNYRGHLLGHVIAKQDVRARRRTYESTVAQVYHSDGSDVVALLCVRQAKRGGESTIASSVTMHDILADERPDLLALLYRTYYSSRMGEERPGELPYYPSPIYTYVDGALSCRPATSYIKDAQRFDEVPRLSAEAKAAMEEWKAIPLRPGVALNYRLRPGDIQFLNNYTVVHGRSEYEDYDDPARRRYLVRILFRMPQDRSFTPEFEARRDGIPLADEVAPNLTLDPDAHEYIH
jgi:hypothetical protein